MSEVEIRTKVRTAIAHICGVDVSKIPESAHFVDDLGLDSLSVVEAFVALEREFQLEDATEEEEALLVGIDEAVQYVQSKLSVQAA